MRDRLHERLHGEQGLAGASLVIIIAWALAAVLMLTGTLVAAQQIDERVFEITNTVGAIKDDTGHIALTQDINEAASGIREAAAPLSGQLDSVIASAGNINSSVDSILATAGEINQTAGTINSTVLSINATARDIGASVDSIHSGLAGTLGHVREIHTGVADINRRADVVIAAVNGIKADTGAIRNEVGTVGVPSIRGHAESIDCNSIVVVLGLLAGSGCTTG